MAAFDGITVIESSLDEAARVKRDMKPLAPQILRVAERMAVAFRSGSHLYACGNGGSACDAMHLVEELVARYKRDRPGLPAHHMMDPATLTCWSNDYDFESVFERQIETMGRAGDILMAISTSGNSPNVVRASQAARKKEMIVIGLLGGEAGEMKSLCDEPVIVPASATERIQEGHIVIIHLLCEVVERMLFDPAQPVHI